MTDQHDLSPTDWVREQTEKILETGTTDSVDVKGMPVIMVTTRGAKTGKTRLVPLMRVEHDGVYAIVASKGGDPKHPVWYHNVRAYPEVRLQDGAVTGDYVAREISGAEKQQWWERAVSAYPPYAEYQERTDRQIPVFLLEPA